MPSAPCSIIGFYTFPSRYRNVIRSKDEDYPSLRPPSRNLIRVFPQQIADQVRDEGNQAHDEGNKGRQNNPATPLGFTILPNTTGVNTTAYDLSPLQG